MTGCWSRVEINDRSFVTGMYVDISEQGGYEVSLGFPLPNRITTAGSESSSSSSGNPYTVVTKTGETIPIAIRKIRSDLSREISWGHCRAVVVGKKLAEAGIHPLLEFTAREPNFHTKSYIMVAPGNAKEISKLTPVFERFPSEVLREFARRGLTLDTSVKDFLEITPRSGDMLAGMLTIGETEMLSEKRKVSTWAGTNGAALFKNGKMVGTFNIKEMRAALWLKNKMKNSVISVKSPTDGKPMSFIILDAEADIKPVVKRDGIRYDIRVEAEDDVMSSESDIDLTDPTQTNQLETMLSKALKDRIAAALKKTQTIGVDVFGFNRFLEWRYPKIWKQYADRWRSVYQNVEIRITTKIVVKRTGETVQPLGHLQHEE